MRIRSRTSRRSLMLGAAVFVAAGCSEGATEPATGSLAVLVSGLPADVNASISVTGPGGFTRTLSASDTLEKVALGTYVVTSSKVTTTQGAEFSSSASTQDVAVTENAVASARVGYAAATGSLRVQITGLPAGAVPLVEVRGEFDLKTVRSADTTVHGLKPGTFTVTAKPVTFENEQWAGTPRERTLSVSATVTPVPVAVTYAVSRPNIMIAGAYITQSVQRLDGGVPLVQGREGLLRVFLTADEENMFRPAVRVRLFQGGTVVFEKTASAVSNTVPMSPTPDLATSSINMPIDKSLINPGLSMVVELDPDNVITEGDETDNRFPAEGTKPLDVRVLAPLRMLLVQLHDTAGALLGNLGNVDTLLSQTVNMFPVGALDVAVRTQPFIIPKPLKAASSSVSEGWGPALSDLRAARVAESNPDHASRMWYGVAKVTYTSGIAGLGYVGYPTSIGWDHAAGSTTSSGSASSVMAHELGHNFGRLHAPCGGVGNPDPNYPYGGGVIGQTGYDILTKQIVPAGRADLMGYCNGIWISDYTYNAVLNFRASTGLSEQPALTAASSRTVQPTLLVWGRVSPAGEVTLNPAFEISTRPALPSRGGSHVVRGLAVDGRELFAYSFEPDRVADMPNADRDFAFAIPMDADTRSELASIVVLGRGGRQARASSRAPGLLANARVRAERAGAGRSRVRWDASAGSMAMIRDAATGHVLGFARGGSVAVRTPSSELEVIVSDGVRSRTSRVRLAQ